MARRMLFVEVIIDDWLWNERWFRIFVRVSWAFAASFRSLSRQASIGAPRSST
jgi:hypothetical protein